VLDLGTGSGAIALAIASERPHAEITAVDISSARSTSPFAIHVTSGCRTSNGVLGSWFEAVPQRRFNMNCRQTPPTSARPIRPLAALDQEPAIALTPGASGLESLSLIAAKAPLHLHEHGWLIMEHGSGQAGAVAALLERHGFTAIRTHLDSQASPASRWGTVHTQH